MGLLSAAALVGPKRLPFLIRKRPGEAEPGKHDHALRHARNAGKKRRDGRRCGRDAGSDREARWRVLRPPARRSCRNRRLRRSVKSIRPRSARSDGQRSRTAEKRSSAFSQCAASSGASDTASASRVGSTSSIIRASIVRASSAARRSASAADSSGLAHQRCQQRQTLERIDRGRDRIAVVGRIERTADALVELRIADRDQSRKQQAGAARADKGVGHGADGAIVRQQDAPRGQPKRIASEPGNQTRWQANPRTSGASGS